MDSSRQHGQSNMRSLGDKKSMEWAQISRAPCTWTAVCEVNLNELPSKRERAVEASSRDDTNFNLALSHRLPPVSSVGSPVGMMLPAGIFGYLSALRYEYERSPLVTYAYSTSS